MWGGAGRDGRGSPECDYSVCIYRDLVATGRYHYANYHHGGAVGWREGFTALRLLNAGFECWTGVQSFRGRTRGGDPREMDAQKRANTEDVERLLTECGFPLPQTVQKHLVGAENARLFTWPTKTRPSAIAWQSTADVHF
jgi:hypothetical protein